MLNFDLKLQLDIGNKYIHPPKTNAARQGLCLSKIIELKTSYILPINIIGIVKFISILELVWNVIIVEVDSHGVFDN